MAQVGPLVLIKTGIVGTAMRRASVMRPRITTLPEAGATVTNPATPHI